MSESRPTQGSAGAPLAKGEVLPDGQGASVQEPIPQETKMYREAMQAADIVRRQLSDNAALIQDAVIRLKSLSPIAIVTCARGSSDHAATYAKYLFETQLGLLTSSAAPSVSSVYGASQQLHRVIYVAISQSGESPDLLAHARSAKQAGATLVVCVNQPDSQLAQLADILIPIQAGAEESIAATKSYIATLSVLLQLVAHWTGNAELLQALAQLPGQLEAAQRLDWSPAIGELEHASNLFVLGRGLGFGVAQEAALKFKEVCGVHAEAFSAAEVVHGPMALIGQGFPVLVFTQQDETRASVDRLIAELAARGARLLVAAETSGAPEARHLPVVAGVHPAIAPLLMIQSFYLLANALAVRRGLDPDRPPYLQKITRTV